jgi:K+-transporting ATPase c subunit
MTDENEQNREQELRERIASLIRANNHAGKKKLSREEAQALQTAASRLDHLLAQSAHAEQQILRIAATRLDELLKNLTRGKDVAKILKRRDDRDETT